MFIKHYAPNRCEPSIEVSVRRGLGVRVHMTKESKLLPKKNAKKVGCVREGVRVDMNKELKLLLKIAKKS